MISVVIVNWNAGSLLEDCIRSIPSEIADMPVEVTVVDNASTDGSMAFLANVERVRTVANDGNYGFARACNQGAAASSGEYLLFLNPDCVLTSGSVEACLLALQQDLSIGVASIGLHNATGATSRSCHNFPTPRHFFGRSTGLARVAPSLFESAMTSWRHDVDRDVDHVIGAFYLLRSSLFSTLGGFDERFFVYLEDLDLSKRVREAGYRVRFIAQPTTYHKGGGTSEKAKAARLFYSTRSRIQYGFKHFSPVAAWANLIGALTVEPIVRCAELILRGRTEETVEVRQAFAQLYNSMPLTLRERHRA